MLDTISSYARRQQQVKNGEEWANLHVKCITSKNINKGSHGNVSSSIIVLHYSANAGMILGLRPASERRRYFVTTSLIG